MLNLAETIAERSGVKAPKVKQQSFLWQEADRGPHREMSASHAPPALAV